MNKGNQLKNFASSFDTIILNIIITFLVFYILCPKLIFNNMNCCSIPNWDKLVAFAIIVLIVKYISENAVCDFRYEEIFFTLQKETDKSYYCSMALLFLSKLLVPALLIMFIFSFLTFPSQSSLLEGLFEHKIISVFTFMLAYSGLFLVPDLVNLRLLKAYKESPNKPRHPHTKPDFNLLFSCVIKWIVISSLVIIIAVIWILYSFNSGTPDDSVLLLSTKKVFFYIMLGQTLLDYLINFRFYLKLGI